MMITMTERDDIDVAVSNNATIPDNYYHEKVSLFIYDKYGEHCPRNDCKTNGICQKEPDFFTDIFLFIP